MSLIGPPPEDVLARPVDDELVLHRPSTGATVTLNATAAAIWARCDGTRTSEEIVAEVVASYGLVETDVVEDVGRLLRRLRETGFLPD